jgi:predicted Zn-dependent protease
VMAFVALSRGQAEAAVQDADDALSLRGRYPEARLVRAEALLRLARGEEARRELARFLDEAPPTMMAERAQAAQTLASVPR